MSIGRRPLLIGGRMSGTRDVFNRSVDNREDCVVSSLSTKRLNNQWQEARYGRGSTLTSLRRPGRPDPA